MVRGNMMRMAWAVGAIALASGCSDCGGTTTPVDCTDTTVTFETPTSGATVDSPFDVSIVVRAPDGSAFAIDGATLKVGETEFTGTATVDGSRATFTGVTGGEGGQTLTASIARGTCSKSATSAVTVRSACSTPAVTAFAFPQDVAPLGVLNSREVPPGTNLQVRVDATCVTGAQVRIKRGTEVVGALAAFTNGTATLTLPTLPDADNARYDLFAELVRDGQVLNTAQGNPAASASIQVNRVLPTVALTHRASFGPMDDADSATAGFQVRITGTAPVDTTCQLKVDSQAAQAATPNSTGDVSADFTVTSGAHTSELTCTDAAGNSATAMSSFVVDFIPPTVAITSPASMDGGATMVVTQSPLQVVVSTTGAEDGSIAKILRNGVEVGAGTVTGGTVTLPVSFGIDGDYALEVRVTDLAGNTTSATLNVTVALSGCGAIFSRPGSCPALLTTAQLANGTYSFQTTSKAVCGNQPAVLYRADVLSDGGVTAPLLIATTTVGSSGVSVFPSVTLASGDYSFGGEVSNIGVDAGVSSVSCRVTVDLDGPAITSPVALSNPINIAQDTQLATPGVQRTLSFSARVPMGGRVDVCTTQSLDPVTMAARTPSAECGTGWFLLQQGVSSPVSGFTFPDGSYQIKVVVVGGGLAVPPSSPPVQLLVDSVRPCVNGLTRSLPQDMNGDGRLNIAELGGAAPRLEFQVGCGDAPATLAAASAVTVRDVVSGAPASFRASTTSFAAGTFTVTLTGAYTTEVDLNLFVEITDQANNKNQLAATNDPATFTLRVDPVVPTCTITSPSVSQTLLGIAQIPGGNFDVIVATSADVGAGGVNVSFTGQTARALTPTLSQATTTYVLSGDATYSIGATCTDQSGNSASATARTTRADLLAPTCNFTAPADAFASGSNDVITTVTVLGLTTNDPTALTINSSVSGIQNNQLAVVGTTATGTVTYPNGTQTITATITDAAGNTCVAPVGGRRSGQLTVNTTSCSLAFAAGGPIFMNPNGTNWLNRSGAGLATGVVATSASVAVGAITTDCGSGRNVYLYQGPQLTVPTGTPQVTSAGGTVTFPLPVPAFQEGQQWTVTIDNGAGVLTHRSFYVSLVQPSIGTIGLQRSSTVPGVIPVAANTSLVFGAATGNRRIETATASDRVFADLDSSVADAQFQLTLTSINGARFGTANGLLDVLEGATSILPALISITASPFDPSIPRLKLGHRLDDSTVDLVIRITSPSGNVFESRHPSEVDVIAPDAPDAGQTLTLPRDATVTLNWAPVYDDGANAASGGLTGGPALQLAGYDVRWTTSSVLSNNLMASSDDYFGSSSKQDGITTWSGSSISKALSLPPINTYYIAVRARDEVGNYSAFTAPTALTNPWTVTTLAAPVASSSFGATVLSAPLVGNDTNPDIVVSATGVAGGGAVYVYDSSVLTASQTGCGTGCQALTPSTAVGTQFGHDLAVGDVGRVGAESRSDLLVASLGSATPVFGRAVLYFGTTASALVAADAIEFRGLDTNNRIGTALATSAAIIRDITGDGLAEIAFAAPGQATNRGRVLIYRGRDRAGWVALRTATDTTVVPNVPYIPVSGATADYVIDGPLPALIAASSNAFGQNRRGLVSVNDLDGDTFPDLAIPTSRSTINKYRIFGSAAIKASTGAAPLDATTAYVQELSLPVGTDNSTVSGVGSVTLANADFFGSTGADLVTTFSGGAGGGQVLLYSALTAAPANPTPTVLSGPLTFGSMLAMGTLDGDATQDLVTATALTTGNLAWVLYQHGGTFETAALESSPVFWVTRLNGQTVTGNSASRVGSASLVTDIGGNNALVLGDFVVGEVRIWR